MAEERIVIDLTADDSKPNIAGNAAAGVPAGNAMMINLNSVVPGPDVITRSKAEVAHALTHGTASTSIELTASNITDTAIVSTAAAAAMNAAGPSLQAAFGHNTNADFVPLPNRKSDAMSLSSHDSLGRMPNSPQEARLENTAPNRDSESMSISSDPISKHIEPGPPRPRNLDSADVMDYSPAPTLSSLPPLPASRAHPTSSYSLSHRPSNDYMEHEQQLKEAEGTRTRSTMEDPYHNDEGFPHTGSAGSTPFDAATPFPVAPPNAPFLPPRGVEELRRPNYRVVPFNQEAFEAEFGNLSVDMLSKDNLQDALMADVEMSGGLGPSDPPDINPDVPLPSIEYAVSDASSSHTSYGAYPRRIREVGLSNAIWIPEPYPTGRQYESFHHWVNSVVDPELPHHDISNPAHSQLSNKERLMRWEPAQMRQEFAFISNEGRMNCKERAACAVLNNGGTVWEKDRENLPPREDGMPRCWKPLRMRFEEWNKLFLNDPFRGWETREKERGRQEWERERDEGLYCSSPSESEPSNKDSDDGSTPQDRRRARSGVWGPDNWHITKRDAAFGIERNVRGLDGAMETLPETHIRTQSDSDMQLIPESGLGPGSATLRLKPSVMADIIGNTSPSIPRPSQPTDPTSHPRPFHPCLSGKLLKCHRPTTCYQHTLSSIAAIHRAIHSHKIIAFDLDFVIHDHLHSATIGACAVLHYLFTTFDIGVEGVEGEEMAELNLRMKHAGYLIQNCNDEGEWMREAGLWYRPEGGPAGRYERMLAEWDFVDNDELIEDLKTIYYDKQQMCGCGVRKGLKELISCLKLAGKAVVVITHGDTDDQWNVLERLGLTPLIDHLVAEGTYAQIEDARMQGTEIPLFERAVADLNGKFEAKIEDILYIGHDKERHILPARAVGIETMVWGDNSRRDSWSFPIQNIRSFPELHEIFSTSQLGTWINGVPPGGHPKEIRGDSSAPYSPTPQQKQALIDDTMAKAEAIQQDRDADPEGWKNKREEERRREATCAEMVAVGGLSDVGRDARVALWDIEGTQRVEQAQLRGEERRRLSGGLGPSQLTLVRGADSSDSAKGSGEMEGGRKI